VSVDFSDLSTVPQLTVLSLKGGDAYLASDYWLAAGELVFLTPGGEHKQLPVGRLDLKETIQVNLERHVKFMLRSEDRR